MVLPNTSVIKHTDTLLLFLFLFPAGLFVFLTFNVVKVVFMVFLFVS